jgi:hypothetical protein
VGRHSWSYPVVLQMGLIERGSIHISRPLRSWVSIHERDDVDHFALSDA